jgi:hypothetical protein
VKDPYLIDKMFILYPCRICHMNQSVCESASIYVVFCIEVNLRICSTDFYNGSITGNLDVKKKRVRIFVIGHFFILK